jgi:NAD(P)-dependent dehydrogenase (short-subunit alcohol dehydrogenase family)
MDPFRLDGRHALVTGAGSGIGAAIALALARAGARVAVADRDAVGGQRTVAELRAAGGSADFFACDVTDEASFDALAKAVAGAGYAVDVLVNNAGIGHVGTLLSTGGDDLDRLYRVNVRGVFNGCRRFVPPMVARGRGSVVTMASVGGVVAVRDRFAYTTSKFAVVGMTKAMALDHSGTGVRFNCICPGRVETPFVQARIAESADPTAAARDMASTQLVGRMITPEEVAAAALYLASDASAMVTGSAFLIDGGWTAGK